MSTPPKQLKALTAYSSDQPLLQILVDAGAAFHCTVSATGALSFVGSDQHKWLGLSSETPLPKELFKILPEKHRESIQGAISRVFRTAEPLVKEGSFDLSPLGGHHLQGWFLFSHPYPWSNRTGLNSTNKQATQLNLYFIPKGSPTTLDHDWLQNHRLCSLGALSTGVAHDLNNLFAGAATFNKLLQDKATDATQKSHLHLIEKTLNKASQLTHSLLSFAREEEELTGPIEPIATCRDITKMVERSLPSEVELTLTLPVRTHPILIKQSELCQIILNLLVNARDAVQEKGNIHLEVSYVPPREPTHLTLTVTDDGSGIGDQEAGRIFDPFFTTKAEGEGTGLGLSIIKQIIDANKGEITFSSSPESHTRFTVKFPVWRKE